MWTCTDVYTQSSMVDTHVQTLTCRWIWIERVLRLAWLTFAKCRCKKCGNRSSWILIALFTILYTWMVKTYTKLFVLWYSDMHTCMYKTFRKLENYESPIRESRLHNIAKVLCNFKSYRFFEKTDFFVHIHDFVINRQDCPRERQFPISGSFVFFCLTRRSKCHGWNVSDSPYSGLLLVHKVFCFTFLQQNVDCLICGLSSDPLIAPTAGEQNC